MLRAPRHSGPSLALAAAGEARGVRQGHAARDVGEGLLERLGAALLHKEVVPIPWLDDCLQLAALERLRVDGHDAVACV